jgi:hypothetical protein
MEIFWRTLLLCMEREEEMLGGGCVHQLPIRSTPRIGQRFIPEKVLFLPNSFFPSTMKSNCHQAVISHKACKEKNL